MRTPWRLHCAATICLLVSGLVTAGPAGAAPPAPDRVVVTLEDGAVGMTSFLRPGEHRFVVRARGSQDGVQLIRPRRGYSVEEYRRDMTRLGSAVDRVARAADRRITESLWFRGGVLVDEGDRAVFWQTLSVGRLWVVSESLPRDVHEVRVSGRVQRTAPTPVSATLTVSDGSVQTPVTMPARGVLRFLSTGTQPHMVGLAKLVDGRTAADAAAYFNAIFDGAPLGDTSELVSPLDESVFGAPTMSVHPGGAMSMRYSLPPGEYIAVCVVLDKASEKYHIQHGEFVGVTLA
jgi:hypothetical protein